MQKIPENISIVLRAALPLFIVIVLFFVVGKFGFGKISEIRTEVESAQKDQAILSQKLEILRNIETTGQEASNIAVTTLPDTNPSLSVVSQLKIISGQMGLTISEIKASSPGTHSSGLSFVGTTFRVIGPRGQIEAFVKSISSMAPITIVDKVKITESSPGSSLGNISTKSFFAPFPTQIPAVGAAISDLTTVERQTLQGLNSLTQPIFTQIPAGEGGKPDPFSL